MHSRDAFDNRNKFIIYPSRGERIEELQLGYATAAKNAAIAAAPASPNNPLNLNLDIVTPPPARARN